ncbi:DUF4270 domain-containing protein [Myroides pelagicus]|uniref:DUF4270 family protein n=1 Tax=Myroides pelagicus TaxID=270914 RepID=A0A7K1GJC8_9FLAO|nr:DUF4270 domain-containing protein [Myroides pelagicus]MEC4113702.1 DUF4270 domain-containing protein [Myroides pelagicus]MTH28898.1 DUF4270 family protein [Myroides pelagicus]
MNQKNIFKGLVLALGIVSLQACDTDFTETGSDIIGGGDFTIESHIVQDIKAYNQPYGPTDAARLPEVSIGSYKDGVYGNKSKSIALNFVTPTVIKDFDETIKVDSAYVYLPYYNTEVDKTENDVTTYKLKGRYGEGTFDLEVYQHSYLMTNDDPAGGPRKYYSNQQGLFENSPNGLSEVLNSKRTMEIDNKSIVIYQKDKDGNDQTGEDGKKVVKEKLVPGLWIDLNKDHFQNALVKFSNSEQFQNNFRGLYLKALPSANGKGTITLINPGQGYLRIAYSKEEKTTNEDGTETKKTVRGELKLPFVTYANPSLPNIALSQNILVNLESNEHKVEDLYPQQPNKETGDSKLFIKGGGEGGLAIIELFKENDYAELKQLREQAEKNGFLLNDAFLTVYTDETSMTDEINPDRLYLYNFDATSNVIDFITDSQGQKPIYGGAYEKGAEDSKREKNSYTFRIKGHIQALLKSKTISSPKLAIAVSNSYTSTLSYMNYKNLFVGGGQSFIIENTPKDITQIPSLPLTTPIGTVINGTTEEAGIKKMKLEIFYTKQKEL